MYSVVFSKEQIADCINRLALELTPLLSEETVAVPILRGGLFFAADLLRALPMSVYISPLTVSSYPFNEVQGEVSITGQEAYDGKQVLLIDDICDSGKSFEALKAAFGPEKSVITVSLVRRANSPFKPDFVGFEYQGDEWLVGYGMDDNGKFRNLDGIYVRNRS